MHEFAAPWSASLKILTTLSVATLCAVAWFGLTQNASSNPVGFAMTGILPLILLVAGAFFIIRGYTLNGRQLLVHRLGWTTRLDLSRLQSAEVDATAMKGSLRVFGNGGLFCFAGKFKNKKLGYYRVWVTNPANAVILRLPDRILVVSPTPVQRFVQCVEAIAKPV